MRVTRSHGIPARRLGLLLTALAAMGCGGGAGTDDPTAPSGAIAISVVPVNLVAPLGMTGPVGSLAITVTRSGAFTGDVTVAADGLPQGMAAEAITIPAGATTGTMTIQCANFVSLGGPLTLRATGAGVREAKATAAVSLSSFETAGFTVAANPAEVTVVGKAPGVPVTVTVTWTTLPVTCQVDLSISGLPSFGVTASFSLTTVTATSNTSTLTLSPQDRLIPGSSTALITGRVKHGSCQSEAVSLAAPIALTVTGSGG